MQDKVRSAFAQIKADEALIQNTMAYLQAQGQGQSQAQAKALAVDPTAQKARRGRRGLGLPKLAGALAAVAVLCVGLLAFTFATTASAYVSIDVNPSIELTLNRFDRVIDAQAFDPQGEQVLKETSVKGKSYADASRLLLSQMELDGYLSGDALVSVTVQAAGNAKQKRLCLKLQQQLTQQLSGNQPAASLEVYPVSPQTWHNARQCHMSPARYLAIQQLLSVDDNATLDAYRDCSIGQIRQRTQECQKAGGGAGGAGGPGGPGSAGGAGTPDGTPGGTPGTPGGPQSNGHGKSRGHHN